VTNQKPELNTRNNKGLSVAIYLVISLPPAILVTVNKSAARKRGGQRHRRRNCCSRAAVLVSFEALHKLSSRQVEKMVKARMTTADVAAEIACLRKLIGMRVANVYDLNPKASLLEYYVFLNSLFVCWILFLHPAGDSWTTLLSSILSAFEACGGVSYMASRNQHWRCKFLPSSFPPKLKGYGGVHCHMLFTAFGGKVSWDLHELEGVSLANHLSGFNSASAFFGNGSFVRGVTKLLAALVFGQAVLHVNLESTHKGSGFMRRLLSTSCLSGACSCS
jgi:hypothetical protein